MDSPRPTRFLLAAAAALFVATSSPVLGEERAHDPGEDPERAARASGSEWRVVLVPGAWEDAPGGHFTAHDGFAWYRARVKVPERWTREEPSLWVDSLTLAVEGVADAHEAFVNGVRVGGAGSFPPDYQSGQEEWRYHRIPAGVLRPDVYNTIAIRVFDAGGPGGFLGTAPVVSSYNREIELAGDWELRAGDDAAWATGPVTEKPERAAYDEVRNAVALMARPSELHRGKHLAPEESLRAMRVAGDLAVDLVLAEPDVAQPVALTFDERGRLWVVEYRQYPYPAGIRIVSRDKYFRNVYDRVPPPPPHGERGADRISIHEDTDGDGTFDRHRMFVDGLNMTTSVAVGRGGVWVLNPPYLLFYPDIDRDDTPDSDPVVHLEGFGLEDAHSLVNSLAWGPDGWLYGAQGSTVSANVRRYGEEGDGVPSRGPLVWRYHPETRRYEIFAEGGGNTFSVEIDSRGRLFSGTNDGDTRGYHYAQGGYHSQAGSGAAKYGAQTNPYAFGQLPPMEHGPARRFSHAFVIYEEGALPERYRGELLGVEPLQRRLVLSDLSRRGSTFRTEDVTRPVESDDPSFRPVALAAGPDGAVYIADFCEEYIAHGQHYQGQLDPSTGRVWRLRPEEYRPARSFDLAQRTSEELVRLLDHEARWWRKTALRLLADRRDRSVIPLLRRRVDESDGRPLESLWALYLTGGLSEKDAIRFLAHRDPHVRLWTARLVGDLGRVSAQAAEALEAFAAREAEIEVRAQLACSAKRLPASLALSIVRTLSERDEDADDPYLPLLLWWALESKAGAHREDVLALFEDAGFRERRLVREHLAGRLIRRYALAGSRADLLACARLLDLAGSTERARELLASFEDAWRGRSLPSFPEELIASLARAGGGSLAFRLRRGEGESVSEALELVVDRGADRAERLLLVRVLGEVPREGAAAVLLGLLEEPDPELRTAALTVLRAYDGGEIAAEVIERYEAFGAGARDAAQVLFATRRSSAERFLDALESGAIDRSEISTAVLEQMAEHGGEVKERIAALRSVPRGELDLDREVERFLGVLRSGTGNLYEGKKLFRERCGRCHAFLGDPGTVGPDLTSYERSDTERLLRQVLAPSAEVREGFETRVAVTADGRILTGLLVDQDDRVVVIRGVDGEDVPLPRGDVLSLETSGSSLMPEDLLEDLSDVEVRSLFAYLRSTQPVPD